MTPPATTEPAATTATETTSASAESSSTGSTSSGTVESTGGTSSGATSSSSGAAGCVGAQDNITADGVVGASTVFAGHPPVLAVDDDLSTSWFGTGPEGVGEPSTYTWTSDSSACILELSIFGNGMHSNPSFQEDFGFGSVTVSILDGDDVVFEESHDLLGTPDPMVLSEPGGVIATQVRLEFYDHEDQDAGGFSELQIVGEAGQE